MSPTIVVVDDDQAILEMVCEMVTDAGMTAIPCSHGWDAVPCILREQPDLAILDMQMPVVDGVEVFQAIRADPLLAHLPVIFLTANADVLCERLPLYLSMGATVLPKPFKIMTLMAMIGRAAKAA